MVPYYLQAGRGKIRVSGSQKAIDLEVHFDDEGKVMGIFDRPVSVLNKDTKIIAIPTSPNQLYIDGFKYGTDSMTIELHNDEIKITQQNRVLNINDIAN